MHASSPARRAWGSWSAFAARDMGLISSPISVFPLVTTITMIVMVLFGGKGIHPGGQC
jgi:hypothetical protein